mgnify:FL=1
MNNEEKALKQEADIDKGHRQGYPPAFFPHAIAVFNLVVVINPAVGSYPAEGRDHEAETSASSEGDIIDDAVHSEMGRFPPVMGIGNAEE